MRQETDSSEYKKDEESNGSGTGVEGCVGVAVVNSRTKFGDFTNKR